MRLYRTSMMWVPSERSTSKSMWTVGSLVQQKWLSAHWTTCWRVGAVPEAVTQTPVVRVIRSSQKGKIALGIGP